ncbi:MAG: ribokinase [Spirochaetales bacterium]|nr:ribokinase [Spirochaetales bacterium]
MKFDTMIIGQVCLDTNTDYDGRTEHRFGGAVLYSGHAANSIGKRVAVVPKGNRNVTDAEEAFGGTGITMFAKSSINSTLMENVYFTADRERRRSRCHAVIDPYTPQDIPDEETAVYHLAGLCYGDIGPDVILECARRGDVAMDIQCMLRHVEADRSLKLHDWPEKTEYLKYIRYLKTDAAEAEILTGLTDREAAARQMYEWGAKEIVITHNTEVIAYDGNRIYRAPLKPRNLTGRTGRGDTTFAGYITERQTSSIQEALTFSAALVSLKMETPGPFMGSRQDVLEYMKEFYS